MTNNATGSKPGGGTTPPGKRSYTQQVSDRFHDKEFYKVLGRGTVKHDPETGTPYLEYFASDADQKLSRIDLQELKTDVSRSAELLKIFALASFAAAVFLIWVTPRLGSWTITADYSFLPWVIYVGVLVAISVSLVLIHLNFIQLGNTWENAIVEFLSSDIYRKMMGIRTCILTFRKIMKWCRFMSYSSFALTGVVLPILLQIGFKIWNDGGLSIREWIWLASSLALYSVGLFVFRRLIHLHGEWRDPTVQLCVMIAESHRKEVTNLRARAAAS
jgi:hypothetical protein